MIDRKNILLFSPFQPPKYDLRFDYEILGYTREEWLSMIRNRTVGQPDFDFAKYPANFYWDLGTPFQEKKIRSFDCMHVHNGMFSESFLAHERLLECWHDLLNKDLKVLPAKFFTKNGQVTEFYLVQVLNKVYGLDLDLTADVPAGDDYFTREVPKATNSFMNSAQIALERMWEKHNDNFYITPELVEKTLRLLNKKELKGAMIVTFREEWEWVYGCYADTPPYTADYPGRSYRELGFPKDMEYY